MGSPHAKFHNLDKDEKRRADLFRETEASTMYPPEKNSKTSKSTLVVLQIAGGGKESKDTIFPFSEP